MTRPPSAQPVDADRNGELEQNQKITIRSIASLRAKCAPTRLLKWAAGAAAPPAWPFGTLERHAYDAIMIDPPWRFALRSSKGEKKSPQARYACLSLDQIAALPVRDLARPDCWLWLWATFPMLPQAIDVLDAWGFVFVTSGTWVKRGVSGRLAMGPGYVLHNAAEMFLIGRLGQPRTASRGIRNVIEAPRREHSRKPDEAYTAAKALFGAGRKADVFACERRPGWEAWGEQADKFVGATE
jgi:N6-adenosine-specific RNA methylase IME4